MKTLFTTLVIFSSVSAMPSCWAQTNTDLNKSFSIAVLCGEYGYDAGVGLELGTPALLKQRISFRVRANKNWLETYKAQYDKWAKYEIVTVSMIFNTRSIERGRGYFELGTSYLFPDQKFSDKKILQGMTSSVGLELFVLSNAHLNVCYYISGGFNYINAYAEKLENKPRYGNGFVFNNGFRFYF